MTSIVTVPEPTRAAAPRFAAARALATVVLAVAALVGATWVSGAVAPADMPWVAGGAGLAVLGAALALLVHRRFVAAQAAQFGNDPRLLSMRLQGLLGLGFGIKVALVVVAVLVLRGNDVKFPQLAAFAVAFAAASLVAQLLLATALLRSGSAPASNSNRSSSS